MKEKLKRIKLSRIKEEETYLINLIDNCIVTKCETIDVYSVGDNNFFVYDKEEKELIIKFDVYTKIDIFVNRFGAMSIIKKTLSNYLGIKIISTVIKKELI